MSSRLSVYILYIGWDARSCGNGETIGTLEFSFFYWIKIGSAYFFIIFYFNTRLIYD